MAGCIILLHKTPIIPTVVKTPNTGKQYCMKDRDLNVDLVNYYM